MKQLKKMASILLILALVLTMTVSTAFAVNTNSHTITITNAKQGHTYEAYQVFAGDISEGKLTNIDWGSGVDGSAILAELENQDAYKNCSTAEDVADVLAGFQDNSSELDAFAKIVGKHLNTPAGESDYTDSKYVISVTGDGYYLVKDKNAVTGDDAATKYILKVVGDVDVQAKSETPSIDKVIVNADSNNGSEGNGTAQDVGSDVAFKLTSTVPAMDGYDSYTYIVNDTLSAGLTFNEDVKVTIGGTEYTDFKVANSGQSFTITFNNFINQKSNAGKTIVITYSAKLNESALTTDKETNTVYLKYSNDPNNNASYGQTPEKIVYVYDFDIVIDKYVDDKTEPETDTRLAGAEFVLYKTVESKTLYYKLDGTAVTWTENEAEATVVTTDENGAARFTGLDSGTYYLHETEAPAGYNLLKQDVEVTVSATYNGDGTIETSTATSIGGAQYQQTQPIENKSGLELPSTGGIGTTIFYALGAVLVIGAGVLLVTRRRMNKNDK